MYESPLTSPTTNNPFNRDFQTRGAEMQTDLKDTLRSFRDTLAFSFQTLNLTLASMNNSVQALGTKIGQLSPGIGGQYIPANPHDNAYYGSLSKAYAQFAGSQNYAGMMTAHIPYNVSPLEFWKERQTEMAFRNGSGALALGASAVEELGTMFGGNYLGGKMARALGMTGTWAKIGMGLPAGMAISAMAGAYFDPFVAAGQEHNRDVAAIKRMSARFSNPFTIRQAQQATRGIEQLAYNELWNTTTLDSRLNMSGFRDLTMMGLQGNMFHGTSPDELAKQVSAASNIVKFLTGVMGNKDVQETMQMVKQLKDMGINVFQSVGAAQTMGLNAFKYGKIMGVDSGSLINAAANMSTAAFGQYGMPAFVGMNPAMRSLAFTQEAEKRGILTPAEIAAGGGIQAMGSRMVQMQANMLANTGIGGAMLYAGWDGGRGFDLNRFRAANANGYFNMLGGAVQNITSQGLGGIAGALVNRNNILASAANTPGGIEALLDQTLAGQIDVVKSLAGPNASIEDQINIATVLISRQNPGIDMGTAKLAATRVLRPSVALNMEAAANRQHTLGLLEDARARNSPGRALEVPGEMWDRFKGSLYRKLIQRPAATVTDKITNALDFSYESRVLSDDRLVNADSLDMFRWGIERTGEGNTPDIRRDATFSVRDYNTAIDMLNNNSGWGAIGHSIQRSGYMANNIVTGVLASVLPSGAHKDSVFWNPLRRSVEGMHSYIPELEDRLAANAIIDNSALWSRITSKDRISPLEALMRVGKNFKDDVTEHTIRAKFLQYADNATAWDPRIAAAESLYLYNRDRAGVIADANAAVERLSLGAEFTKGGLEQAFGKKFFAENFVQHADGTFKTDMTPDKMYMYLTGSNEAERYINSIAKQRGMDLDVARAAFALGLSNRSDDTRNNRLATMVAAGYLKDIDTLGEGFASLTNASRYINGAGATKLSLSANTSMKLLEDLGLSREDLSNVISTGKREDLDVMGTMIARLQEKSLSVEDQAAFNKLSPAARRAIANVAKFRSVNGYADPGAIVSKDKILNSIGNTLSLEGYEYTSRMFANLGIELTADQINDMYLGKAGGNFVNNFMSMDFGANTEGNTIQSNMRSVMKLDNDRLGNLLKRSMSDSAFNAAYGENGIDTQAERDKALRQYLINATRIVGKESEAKIEHAAGIKQSAIDTAVEATGGKPYVRVQLVDDEIKTARENLSKTINNLRVNTTVAKYASTYKDKQEQEGNIN